MSTADLKVGTTTNIDVVGACDHGYACAYMNSLAWKNPTTPLPSETNPRFVFERLFGIGARPCNHVRLVTFVCIVLDTALYEEHDKPTTTLHR